MIFFFLDKKTESISFARSRTLSGCVTQKEGVGAPRGQHSPCRDISCLEMAQAAQHRASAPAQGAPGAWIGHVWDPAFLGSRRRRNNPTHLPDTELPHLSPLRHSVSPGCHTEQRPASIAMASINIPPPSL